VAAPQRKEKLRRQLKQSLHQLRKRSPPSQVQCKSYEERGSALLSKPVHQAEREGRIRLYETPQSHCKQPLLCVNCRCPQAVHIPLSVMVLLPSLFGVQQSLSVIRLVPWYTQKHALVYDGATHFNCLLYHWPPGKGVYGGHVSYIYLHHAWDQTSDQYSYWEWSKNGRTACKQNPPPVTHS